ncbi:DUF2508 family protein [Alicyclobacillus dauci]|uniref:DUF2508 family protein n=1 Tax=Alicyclobacillus dauci TaxID=1475485 RepID=A0ABY6Z3U6_9BACL|nr:DUF2508 family protein [Alicyclobacillus dauci]WAH37303.1 DUF2508 family protein [Alicyclobacillus dauci]
MTLSPGPTKSALHPSFSNDFGDTHHGVPKVDMTNVDKFQFLQEVLKSRRELLIAREQFEQVSDPLLIDHVVFRIGAAERHLNYLFKLAEEHGIAFDGAQWDWTADTWRID